MEDARFEGGSLGERSGSRSLEIQHDTATVGARPKSRCLISALKSGGSTRVTMDVPCGIGLHDAASWETKFPVVDAKIC